MNWNFFKTNWFSIALVLLVLGTILRSKGEFSFQNCFSSKTGKTETLDFNKGETSFGLAMEPVRRSAQPIEIDQATATAFLKRFGAVAVSERKKFGVPASILLATAFLNSNIGLNDAAVAANNLFTLPCSKEWDGASVALGDQCVRKYDTAWASWRDFSIFLTTKDWYGDLRHTAGKDWKKWAKGLNNKEISPISNFGQKLAEVVTFYHLDQLDH